MCVAAWSYVTAATFMGLTAGLFVERTDWKLPEALYGPMVYWIFVCSVMGYYVVTFATQHLPASQVGPLLAPACGLCARLLGVSVPNTQGMSASAGRFISVFTAVCGDDACMVGAG